MTPGIASSRAELSAPLLPPHFLPPRAVSHFSTAVSASPALLVYSVKSISPSLSVLPIRSTASFSRLPTFSAILSVSFHSSSALTVFTLPSAVRLALTSFSFFCQSLPPNLFFLTFNLFLSNYSTSMADQQRLVL